ncbi:hypothetical protein [Marinobacter sp. S6332]|uniref:hypothetical protein n=1 Tax=Marinobacter sp. S6332 TaxID=2926403 RepID=UPI001FF488C4|nr:hypothetical protein [Marinobacter sp. S6332]MCK0165758.1 hypothetical protein [Marinobacter sp. S6332]
MHLETHGLMLREGRITDVTHNYDIVLAGAFSRARSSVYSATLVISGFKRGMSAGSAKQ